VASISKLRGDRRRGFAGTTVSRLTVKDAHRSRAASKFACTEIFRGDTTALPGPNITCRSACTMRSQATSTPMGVFRSRIAAAVRWSWLVVWSPDAWSCGDARYRTRLRSANRRV